MTMAEATIQPVKKKRNISTFRRVLWHVNRTDLGWLVKGAVQTYNFRDVAARRKFVDQLPSSPALTAKADHLGG